eukprot:367933-Rhodomonas_salina.2
MVCELLNCLESACDSRCRTANIVFFISVPHRVPAPTSLPVRLVPSRHFSQNKPFHQECGGNGTETPGLRLGNDADHDVRPGPETAHTRS